MKNLEKTEEMTREAEAAMEVVARLNSILPFTVEHIEKTSFEERVNDGLGIAVSRYTKWSGVDIMEIFYSALEDANFHKEAAQVAKMLKKYDVKEEAHTPANAELITTGCGSMECRGGCGKDVAVNPNGGRWFITIGHPGFNSKANNGGGYWSRGAAEKSLRYYAAKGVRS